MKTRILLSMVLLTVMASTYGQKPAFELTFTAIDSASYVKLDSIRVMNRTQGGSNILYWPDTSLTLGIASGDQLLYIGYSTFSAIGIQEANQNKDNFQVFQNYPNPVKDITAVTLYLPEKGTVCILVTDMPGKGVIDGKWLLDKGYHSFRFSPGNGNLFFLTAQWNGITRSIKILTTVTNLSKTGSLEYMGSDNMRLQMKSTSVIQSFVQESGILDFPDTSKTYTFQFATNIPCPGTPTVTYDGQVYNTIQIFSQCWLKENLNAGTMINSTQEMQNNGIIEKYCSENNEDTCTKYGGLYQWQEMMQYTTTEGVQGICPPGWHVPMNEEWKVLEGAVDSQYGIGDTIWDYEGQRGFDAGLNLKSTSNWKEGIGTDLFGFSCLPGGFRDYFGYFYNRRFMGNWWSTTMSTDHGPWSRLIRQESFVFSQTQGYEPYLGWGFSVRCIMDY